MGVPTHCTMLLLTTVSRRASIQTETPLLAATKLAQLIVDAKINQSSETSGEVVIGENALTNRSENLSCRYFSRRQPFLGDIENKFIALAQGVNNIHHARPLGRISMQTRNSNSQYIQNTLH